MSRMILGVVVAFAVGILSIAAFADQDTYDWYDDIGPYLVHDVDHHFYLARTNFEDKDLKGAAHEIRKAGALVEMEAGRATGEGYDALNASVHELEKLAYDVERGNITSVKDISTAFARANYVLATHHYAKAVEAWKANDTKTTGQALKATAVHLERAIIWAGYEGETLLLDAIKDAGIVADKLVNEGGWAADEVGKILDAIGKEIKKLGVKFAPAKK